MYESSMQKKLREQYRLVNTIFGLLGLTVKVLSFGKIDLNLTDCIVVLRKDGTNDARFGNTV